MISIASEQYQAGWERIFGKGISSPTALMVFPKEVRSNPGAAIFECSKCFKKHPATSFLEWAPHHSPKARVPDTITTVNEGGRYLFRCTDTSQCTAN